MTYTERIQYKRRQDSAYQAGHDAVTNLQAALALADLTLPSLSNDGPVAGHGFVRLGGCNAAFANRLAEVVAAGAHALRCQQKAADTAEQPQVRPQQHPAAPGVHGIHGVHGVHGVQVDGYRILRAEAPAAAPDPVVAFLLAVRGTTRHPARVDRRPMPAH
ncbi:hypothetical protein [Streptomyces sp. IMTB 1903]|uniref:hypothetical protein n=1 Tax=Streptomyces sp. IMTB 1903 TaxID=1776680 RepID=UPI001F19D662|nr:hypothetical protein [Streptomyces sp. IMTB 1903]